MTELRNSYSKTLKTFNDPNPEIVKRIDSFLSVIESSAILFREGLNLLRLQRDINDALSLFTRDMPGMA